MAVRLSREGNIFILTISGQGQHYLTPSLIQSMRDSITQVDKQAQISGKVCALITTNDNGSSFSEGIDYGSLNATGGTPDNQVLLIHELVKQLIALKMPTLAALSGNAYSFGLLLALAHDYVVVANNPNLGLREVEEGAKLPPFALGLLRSRVGNKLLLRDMVLASTYYEARYLVEQNVINGWNVSTLLASVKVEAQKRMEKVKNGEVYAESRSALLAEVLNANP